MIRYDLLKELKPILSDHLVVCNIGAPSQELHEIDDQPSNFYMLGTMGLASSIGLGLSIATEKKVVVIDGDGSVLTNMGSLATIGNNPQPNLVVLIVDNGSYGSTGDQPTYTGGRTSLAGVAEACGCDTVIECPADQTPDILRNALAADRMTVIISRCDSGNRKCPVISMNPISIRERFMAEVAR
ncbi:thiamine pyrophosphate-dependent enzyme [Tropicimonas sp. IMCC6043]|uniref:thiamine pyrophosphate-dependent enzyme n=1 Tax=Tropicimonas sp. IMCC6043 TaxID=2510645 RepID=UPI00101C0055|nr:thiamine pyrophosphate-dependent enzyme [Tropicimonas sp. IMCC6043]RYH08628.1 sulfopyruvate decarboxylase subunit beta [Tropicimonas sp. IMCC6043]